jgi:hypothetical protein
MRQKTCASPPLPPPPPPPPHESLHSTAWPVAAEGEGRRQQHRQQHAGTEVRRRRRRTLASHVPRLRRRPSRRCRRLRRRLRRSHQTEREQAQNANNNEDSDSRRVHDYWVEARPDTDHLSNFSVLACVPSAFCSASRPLQVCAPSLHCCICGAAVTRTAHRVANAHPRRTRAVHATL